jgi:uncharacterized protein (DUF2236 family)
MSAMWSIVFDDQAQAGAALDRVASRHEKVRGIVSDAESRYASQQYDACDQDLLLWVHATLIDSAMMAFDFFVHPLSLKEKTDYYADSKKLALLFGISETVVPASLGAFEAYMGDMLTSADIAVGATARRLAQMILYARPWIFRMAGPLFRFVTAGLLPETLRRAYGLRWSKRNDKILGLVARAVRITLPIIPAPIRIVPNARAAEKKAGRI